MAKFLLCKINGEAREIPPIGARDILEAAENWVEQNFASLDYPSDVNLVMSPLSGEPVKIWVEVIAVPTFRAEFD